MQLYWAVEIYNKKSGFRSESYISLIIIAWIRLFHCRFI
ncbi:DUF3644 domain-containing protein [Legionella santicrucis]